MMVAQTIGPTIQLFLEIGNPIGSHNSIILGWTGLFLAAETSDWQQANASENGGMYE